MSVANRYKVLTFTGSQCFALLRAMSVREAHLVDQLAAALQTREQAPVIRYMEQQLADIRATREAFNITPFMGAGS